MTHYALLLWHPVVTTLTTAYCYDIPSLWLTTAYCYDIQSLRHPLRPTAMTSISYDTHYGLLLWHPVVMTHYDLLLCHPVVMTLTTAYCYDIPSLWLTTAYCYDIQSLRHPLRLTAMPSSRYDTHYGLLLWHPVVTTLTTAYCYDIPSLWLTTAYCYDIQSLRHPLRLTAMTSSR